jgi:hypothetical protein
VCPLVLLFASFGWKSLATRCSARAVSADLVEQLVVPTAESGCVRWCEVVLTVAAGVWVAVATAQR